MQVSYRRFYTMNSTVNRILDATGLLCPEPVMMLHKAIKESNEGDVIEVHATDPSTLRDIPKFCQFLGHELIEQKSNDNEYVFWICKKLKG